MKITKINLGKLGNIDVFHTWIYPLFASYFLRCESYESFAYEVSITFILNEYQWTKILEYFEKKESLKTIINL